MPYLPPAPFYGTGLHRCLFLLFKQDGVLARAEVEKAAGCCTFREDFAYSQWAACLGQGFSRPAGVTGFYVEWEGCCDLYHHAARCRPPEPFLSPAQREAAQRDIAQGLLYTPQATKAMLDEDEDDDEDDDDEDEEDQEVDGEGEEEGGGEDVADENEVAHLDGDGDGDGDGCRGLEDEKPVQPSASPLSQDSCPPAAPSDTAAGTVDGPRDGNGLGSPEGQQQQQGLQSSSPMDAAGSEPAASELQEEGAADPVQDMDFSQWMESRRPPPPLPPAASSEGVDLTSQAAQRPVVVPPPPLPPKKTKSSFGALNKYLAAVSKPLQLDGPPPVQVIPEKEKRFRKFSKDIRRNSFMWEPAMQTFLDDVAN